MNETITSAGNSTVKLLRKLATSAKARREEGLSIAEGAHLVQSYLSAGGVPSLYVRAESAGGPEVAELDTRLVGAGVREVVVSDGLFASIATIHPSVGIMVVFAPVRAQSFQAIQDDVVLLEDIQDPGNVGTILRTIAASGVRWVALSEHCASPWSPKALRAGMGAQFGLDIFEGVDLVGAVREAKLPVYVTTLSEKSRSLYEVDLGGPVAWVFGNEGAGVSEELAALATEHVSIPQAESSIESLNVAAAAAVCLYERYRQSHL